jgi:hypothetical protein
MSKRPAVDLAALTSEAATPMSEASQRAPRHVPAAEQQRAARPADPATRTENLQALAFKVPQAFRRRFRQRAADADLKLNELLFEALDAWEASRGLKR